MQAPLNLPVIAKHAKQGLAQFNHLNSPQPHQSSVLLCITANAAQRAQITARAVQIHQHDVAEGVPQHTKTKTEWKGFLSFVKSRTLQDHCGSHTSDEQSLWLSWGGGKLDLTTLSDLPKAIH